jgi:hypothetical protein
LTGRYVLRPRTGRHFRLVLPTNPLFSGLVPLRIRVRIDRLSAARGIAPLRMSMTIQRQESRANLWS